MANYRLSPKYELPNVGGSWVKRVELDQHLQHLYCCSDTDLHAYDLQGNLLFQFNNAHSMSITGCAFSLHSRLLITCSMDTEVKVWSITGGLVHTFRGHSKAVTNLVLHPETSSIVITSSLDGSVRQWSLDTMDMLYSVVISSDGVLWMGITEDKSLYASTVRNITVWNLNYVCQFWGLTRSKLMSLQLYPSEKKSARVVAEGDDSSIRIFNRASRKNLSIVLPPPPISPLQHIKHMTYCREINVMYVLINAKELWLYTTRTDPACRMAVWDVHDIQESLLLGNEPEEEGEEEEEAEKEKAKGEKKKKGKGGKEEKEEVEKKAQEAATAKKLRKNLTKNVPNHRATEHGVGTETITDVNCVCALDSIAIMWSEDGMVCPLTQQYLLMGLEDGRILFMDPMVKAKKYFQFRANKDPIVDIKQNLAHNTFLTRCSQKGADTIQIWSLPDLVLQYEVFCAPQITTYARLTHTLLCGYSDGVLEFNELVPMEDPGPLRASGYLAKGTKGVIAKPEDLVADMTHKRCNTEHKEAIVAIDACTAKSLFCSISSDGAIKLWEELGYALLMEIMLNDTLCGGCFLNNKGDLLLGFQNHLFSIELSTVYPGLRSGEDEDEDKDDADSDIFEDPYVVYEGIPSNEDLLTMDRYLVPFKMNFSRDFLEGNMKQSNVKLEGGPLLSDSETDISMAPTDTYLSPHDTPRNLSLLDLTLAADVSKYDLLERDLTEVGLLRAIQDSQSIKSRVMTKKDKLRLKMLEKRAKSLEKPSLGPDSDGEALEEDNVKTIRKSKKNVSRRKTRRRGITGMTSEEEDWEGHRYDLPHFGQSPGPTPTPSPPSTPNTPSQMSVSEGGESTEEEVEVEEKPKAVAAQPVTKKTTTKAPVQDIMKQKIVEPVAEKRVDMSKVKIDTKSLFANKRVVMTQKKEADHGHQKSGGSVLESELSKPKREVVKKQMKSDRKKPVKKSVVDSDDSSEEEEPPPRRPPVKKKAAAKPVKKAAQPKVEESPREPEPAKPEKSREFEKHSANLEVGPRKFGAGAGAGASSSGKAPPLPQKKKTPIQYNQVAKSESGIGEEELTEAAVLAEDTSAQQNSEAGQNEAQSQVDEADDPDRAMSAKSSRSRKSGSSSAKSLKFGIDASLDFDAAGRSRSFTESTAFRDSDYESVLTDVDVDLELTNQQHVTHISFQTKGAPDTPNKHDLHPGSRPKSVQWHDATSEQYNESAADMEALERSTLTSPDPSRRSITPGDGFYSDTDSIRDGQMSMDTMSILDRGSLLPVDSVSMRSFLLSPGDRLQAGADDMRSSIMTPATPTDTVTDITRPLRPHTAGVYYRDYSEHGDDVQDLEATYMDALRRYQNSPGVAPLDKLYRNDGTSFDDHWQERAIERHLLLKMQRQLRSQSAAERRQLLDLRQKQKRKALLGHHNCDQPHLNGQNRASREAEVAMHLFHVERANTPVSTTRGSDRSKSAPAGQVRGGGQQVPPTTPKTAFVQPVPQMDKAELSAERPFRYLYHLFTCIWFVEAFVRGHIG
ncbi:uncharacterized protein LOC106150715 [Lingula anatina]|uniref:Uncharacterized protein LOC106150715 n=1 Tax=Lingula anatina TaxID=7574 RepID=A0A1S3H1W7_LINAN|nr:uncharacterized protein LOC106150715 [Lingula anatina]|eukprot:XP_013379134.1 uncharacterized protein LOC106150715 [Lingula anatina]